MCSPAWSVVDPRDRSIDYVARGITSLIDKNYVPQMFARADSGLPGLQSAMVVMERWHAAIGCPPFGRSSGHSRPAVQDAGDHAAVRPRSALTCGSAARALP